MPLHHVPSINASREKFLFSNSLMLRQLHGSLEPPLKHVAAFPFRALQGKLVFLGGSPRYARHRVARPPPLKTKLMRSGLTRGQRGHGISGQRGAGLKIGNSILRY